MNKENQTSNPIQSSVPQKSSVPNNSDISNNITNSPHFFHCDPAVSPFSTLSDIQNMKVLIMGLGLHGGGEASVRFFLKHGAFVTVTDLKTADELKPTLESLKNDTTIDYSKIRFILGYHTISDFEEADLVIKNPGVKYEKNIYLAKARHIETDISIFLRFTQAPIIAVTGSKGKSSTASAIHFGLKKAGYQSFLGGNITFSPLNFLEHTNSSTPVVLELSSWQLSDLRGRNVLKPKIAIITKIVPDHLNWYGTMENYIQDKKLIYESQDTSDITICSSDSWGDIFAKESKALVLRYSNTPFQNSCILGSWLDKSLKGFTSKDTINSLQNMSIQSMGTEDLTENLKNNTFIPILDTLLLPGAHMRENILIASLAMLAFGVNHSKIASIMAQYPGVPHRIEFFHSIIKQDLKNSVKTSKERSKGTEDLKENLIPRFLFYNDSAATVPEATIAALNSFDKPIHLICGGTDKNLDFTELTKSISKAKSIYLLSGTGTEILINELKKSSVPYFGPFSSLFDLLLTLKTNLKGTEEEINENDEVILFSPGATSFEMFKNEFDRGNSFKKIILKLF